ncbi:N-alpha-acetyltransferase 40 [Schistosoma japonicum]|uniref:N-alpha-acetyltransferase 40 n=1 Tax=Schistosoma japonicum TaxID=6182 RepID=A0A4Z2CZC1_SCHJA|nr:N-alpha-acetyltransferase 40 [Schistosoma japonicum]KAH8876479.1 N-alpha-acetyltransferase 40 [Schistosoma japonicum]TNN09581.1 N-alpha-acetyltransferase 40 [Schistosoma japonicum]TNN09582.1 N-alpha-acetyltransferase 40 [Schistosoma japonicum]
MHRSKKGGLISYQKSRAKELVESANKICCLTKELNISLETPDYLNINDIITIDCIKACKTDVKIIDELMELLQNNMQSLYSSSSWGWNAEAKRDEAFSSKSWLIICRCQNSESQSIVGFVSFRFERENNHPVLYCYEIQLYPQFRHLHVGTFLMNTLMSIALASDMHRVMLTVFKSNKTAIKFFEKLGFKTDETDPSLFKGIKTVDYRILSKLAVR